MMLMPRITFGSMFMFAALTLCDIVDSIDGEIIPRSVLGQSPTDSWSIPQVDADAFTVGQTLNNHQQRQRIRSNDRERIRPLSRLSTSPFLLGQTFQGISYVEDVTLNADHGYVPPDPICAASTTTLVGVVNNVMEIRTKQGGLLFKLGLLDFFNSLSSYGLLYDPRVVYDEYEDRFVMVVLDKIAPGQFGQSFRHLQFSTNATGNSTILMAVSKSGSPGGADDWYFQAINALEYNSTVGDSYWADYPGVGVSPEALYITANMVSFNTGIRSANRLWIISKQNFYNGGPVSFQKYNLYNGRTLPVSIPAVVYGGPIGNNIGTFLVAYDGYINSQNNSFIYVTQIQNPSGTPKFTSTAVKIGYGDTFSTLIPTTPQLGTSVQIDFGDRRALDAKWRNNSLWMTTTILPFSGPNANQVTALWVRINTNTTPFTMADKGEIGGEDIATGTYTAFASVAVNSQGVAAFGFAASGPLIHPGAYVVGRNPSDPAGTVSSSFVVHEGLDYYNRTNGYDRNRWGDYSGIAVDPVDDSFWVFNEYADVRGDLNQFGEDGLWNTAWARFIPTGTVKTSSPTSTPPTPQPTNQPTRLPTPFPTPLPTLQPTHAAPAVSKPQTVVIKVPPHYCFSEANTVVIEGKGVTEMKNLQIGDKVRDSNGNFVEVYSFGHFQPDATVEYLQIHVKGIATPLEISHDHLVFVNGSAVPASILARGDKLDLITASADILEIRMMIRKGAYAPFTTSGTILVSGVAASSYVTLQRNSPVLVLGRYLQTALSMHWLAHVFQAFHRMSCNLVGTDVCRKTEHYNRDGISNWVEIWYSICTWLVQQPSWIMATVLVPTFFVALCVYALECGWKYLLAGVIAIYYLQLRRDVKKCR